MEQEHNRMDKSSRRDVASEDSSPTARARNTRLSQDISSHRIVVLRTASLGRHSGSGSWRLGSIKPNLIIEGVSADTAALSGVAGDQVVGLEMAENGSRSGLLSRMNSKDSSHRGSVSFFNDHKTIPQELPDRIDSSLAQVGCRGSQVDDKDDEDGFMTFADDALILSFRHPPHEASFPSVVTPLTEEIVSPVPPDSILCTEEKKQMKNIASVKDYQYKLVMPTNDAFVESSGKSDPNNGAIVNEESSY